MRASDQKLVRKALSGDDRAAAALAERYQRDFFNLFMWLSRDRDLAEDVTQEALVRCWERLPQYRGEASLRTWMHKVALSVFAGHQRRESAQRTADARYAAERSHAISLGNRQLELRIALAEALSRLPEPERRAVVLCKLQGFTLSEAAGMLGEPPGTLAWRVSTGLKQLRQMLADDVQPETTRGEVPTDV